MKARPPGQIRRLFPLRRLSQMQLDRFHHVRWGDVESRGKFENDPDSRLIDTTLDQTHEVPFYASFKRKLLLRQSRFFAKAAQHYTKSNPRISQNTSQYIGSDVRLRLLFRLHNILVISENQNRN